MLIVIADIVHSSRYSPAERSAVQEFIVSQRAEGQLGFRVAAGDEFEWLLDDEPRALDRILKLRATLGRGSSDRPTVGIRVAIARGEPTVRGESPYEYDGPPFHAARAAMQELGTTRLGSRDLNDPFEPAGAHDRWTAFAELPEPNGLLAYMDAQMSGWNPGQWAAIDEVLSGKTYEAAGSALGVSAQSVHKRLSAARLDLYLLGQRSLKETLW